MNLTDKELITYWHKAGRIKWWVKYEFLLFLIITRAVFNNLPLWIFIVWIAIGVYIVIITGINYEVTPIEKAVKKELKQRKLWEK